MIKSKEDKKETEKKKSKEKKKIEEKLTKKKVVEEELIGKKPVSMEDQLHHLLAELDYYILIIVYFRFNKRRKINAGRTKLRKPIKISSLVKASFSY